MQKIKIAHIVHSVGGVDVYLRLILENIDPQYFENIIIHGKEDTHKEFIDKNANKLKSFKINIYRNISFVKDIKSIFQTIKILKKEKPDVIHAHSAKGGVIGRVVGKILGINVLYTPNAFSYLSAETPFKRKIFLWIEKKLVFKNNYLLATSNSEKNRAINDVGYPNEKVILFNNSIQPIDKINELTIPKTWPNQYICTVGRPSYQKNIELMIQVLNEVVKNKKIHLVLMGVGHHSDKLEEVKCLINEFKLNDYVTIIDWTARENIFNVISNSTLYLSTARYEGLPYSVIEALALGKPCIVSDCDGNRDLITNGYNGYVVKNEAVETYKENILKLLDDAQLADEFSKNAQKTFDNHFNMLKNIKEIETIYTQYKTKKSD